MASFFLFVYFLMAFVGFAWTMLFSELTGWLFWLLSVWFSVSGVLSLAAGWILKLAKSD